MIVVPLVGEVEKERGTEEMSDHDTHTILETIL